MKKLTWLPLVLAACGEMDMNGRAYLLVDEETRKSGQVWLDDRPVTSALPVEFDVLESRLILGPQSTGDTIWAQSGQLVRIQQTEPQALPMVERLNIGEQVRGDALLMDAEPAVFDIIRNALGPDEVVNLGFGNAHQVVGRDLLVRSAWLSLPKGAQVAVAPLKIEGHTEGAREILEGDSHEHKALPFDQDPSDLSALLPFIGLHERDGLLIWIDAEGGYRVFHANGCALSAGRFIVDKAGMFVSQSEGSVGKADLDFGSDGRLRFRGQALAENKDDGK